MLGADPLVGDIKPPENKLLDRINDAILSIKTSAELSEENKSDLLSKVQNELLGASETIVEENR